MPVRKMRLSGFLFLGLSVAAMAQVNPSLYAGLRWRNIGPHHGGRVSAVGAPIGPGQEAIFYAGLPIGGLMKTSDAGETWFPIFDQFKNVDGIGAVAVAPSDANIVYVGTGDSIAGDNGDGMYKSTDAGKTWTHIGLENTVKINLILISPTDPNVVLASTQGDPKYNGRGVYRTTDGGQTWTNVLDPKGYNGTLDIARAYDDPSVVFAATEGEGGFRFGPPPPGAPKPKPAELFQSTDGGVTWTQITTIPDYPGRIGVAVAMHTNAQRIYIEGNNIHGGSGLFRSDDGGQTWTHMDPTDRRVANGQGSYDCGVYVDSQNPDIVYTISTSIYRSTDGGHTFHAFKGAPDGEDAHPMWIDPTNGHRMITGMDQGAGITLNNGATWSSYYSIEAGQFYHIITTDQYPFWVYGSQQDTGASGTRNRSDNGEVNHDWRPIASSEFGRMAASPVNPEIIYGVGTGPAGGGSGLIKQNMATGDWENVAPNFGMHAGRYHQNSDFAKHFDTAFDPNALYVAYQCLMVTTNGARTWKIVSPDLTTGKSEAQIPCGAPEPGVKIAGPVNPYRPRGNSIADFTISTAKKGMIWTVSSNGQIYNTFDGGKHWTNVTNIADLSNPEFARNVVFMNIQASHQNPEEAYVSAHLGRISNLGGIPFLPGALDANVALIWRTTDGGKTWTKIVNGLPSDQRTGSYVNVVREDPKQPGLLFCGTESAVYVSFDDGSSWEPLQNNMPTTSVRDLRIQTFDHENDLAAGTFGRGFWVLDDITPLQEIATHEAQIAAAPAYLFEPGDAIRSRVDTNRDMPTEPWEHHAPNPPYGAYIYYYLGQAPSGPISLSIYGANGRLVDTITSTLPPPITGNVYPRYWLASPQSRALSTQVGANRFVWNLHFAPPLAFRHDMNNSMASVEHEITPGPKGPQVIPGVYTVKLTVDRQTYTRKLTVINDPRIGQGPEVMAALDAQNKLNLSAYDAMNASYEANRQVETASRQVAAIVRGGTNVVKQAKALQVKLKAFGGTPATGGFFVFRRPAKPGAKQSFIDANNNFNTLVSMVQIGLDMAPTPAQLDAWKGDCQLYNQTVTAWNQMKTETLVSFNHMLSQSQQQPITVSGNKVATLNCSQP
ncbi:MAG: WD40/YVTN/BNR-like repeat-containing protein [Terriglobales bacterium]